MKITAVDPIAVSIPFSDGGRGVGVMPQRWNAFDMVLVRVETDAGITGWGEAFAYFCAGAVSAAVREMIAPLAVGREIDDIPSLNLDLQRRLALFGRYGITIFALSGLDIALWDIRAKAEGRKLSELLAPGQAATALDAYASLVRYGDRRTVEHFCAQVSDENYGAVKLHEVTMPEIRAARHAMGEAPKLMVDVNNAWTVEETLRLIPELRECDTLWLEEPVFPPEDWDAMARIRASGIKVAAGENACTSVEFGRLMRAVDYVQPSVTKVGGISEFLKVARLADGAGIELVPHSPYFGPGLFATLHLAAARPVPPMVEYLYVRPEACVSTEALEPDNARFGLPPGPGIGFEPDFQVIERMRRG